MKDRSTGERPEGVDPALAKGRTWFAEARVESAREAAALEDWKAKRRRARVGSEGWLDLDPSGGNGCDGDGGGCD